MKKPNIPTLYQTYTKTV